MRCTRNALVLPGLPGGLPATMTILSPLSQRPVPSKRVLDLVHHVVGMYHRRDDEGLHAPGQRQLAARGLAAG